MCNDWMRRPVLAMTLALAAGACQGKSSGTAGMESAAGSTPPAADTTSPVTDSAATGRSATDSTGSPKAGAPKAGLNDATILGMLDEVNKADSAGGALAAKKATDPEVKDFARLMMSEHHGLRAAGEDLAKKMDITPKPPVKDPVAGYVAAENAALQKAKKGADFDQTYIDHEVAVHQAVLDAANMSKVSTTNQEIKDLIQTAVPVIQKHLERAQAIQKRLSPTA